MWERLRGGREVKRKILSDRKIKQKDQGHRRRHQENERMELALHAMG